jgi:hypothetical protein
MIVGQVPAILVGCGRSIIFSMRLTAESMSRKHSTAASSHAIAWAL